MLKKCLILILFCLVSNVYASTEIGTINNLKYVIYNVPDSEINAINVLIRAGSIYDPEKKFGLAYLVSHILKRGGTKNYSTDALLNKLDETGIELSTGCSKDFIFLNMKFVKKETANALKIFKEILLLPAFNKKEFLSLKKETISLITSYQNNYDYVALHNGAINILKNPQYSHSSFGEIKDIKNIFLKDVKMFYKKYFVPENTIITFAGNFNVKTVKSFLNENFKAIQKNFKQKEIYPIFFNKKTKVFKQKNVKQSYIYILFPSFGLKDERYYSVRVLSFILGGNLISILAEKIRKEQGLAYSVFATNYSMVNGGFFIIGMQTENSKREQAVKSIIEILNNIKEKGIEEKKIVLAKKYLSGAIPISLQSINSIASNISSGIYLSKPIPPWEYDMEQINNVSAKRVNQIIKDIFNFKRMVISIVGKK